MLNNCFPKSLHHRLCYKNVLQNFAFLAIQLEFQQANKSQMTRNEAYNIDVIMITPWSAVVTWKTHWRLRSARYDSKRFPHYIYKGSATITERPGKALLHFLP